MTTHEVLTLKETAHFLRISIGTLKKMIENNEVPYKKIGKQSRFLKEELITFMKENRTRNK